MVHAITYDLNKVGQNYEELYKRIQALGDAIHPLQNLWLLSCIRTADGVRKYLQEAIDSNDSLFVAQMHRGEYSAWMSQSAHSWLDSKL